MERLELKQKTLAQALKRLNSMIVKYYEKKEDQTIDEEDFLAYQDSVIKRFALRYSRLHRELRVKIGEIKEYLFGIFGVECAFSKKVFREALLQNLLSQDDADLLLKTCDDRNLTVHRYDEDHSAEVAQMVIEYYSGNRLALHKI